MTRKDSEKYLRECVEGFGANPDKVVIAWTRKGGIPDAHGLTFNEGKYAVVLLEEGTPRRVLLHEAFHAAFSLLDIEEKLAQVVEQARKPVELSKVMAAAGTAIKGA